MFRFKRQSGVATLPTVIILSAIILEVAVAAVTIAAALASSANNQRLASQALSDARTGADDAFMRIVRNKNCPNAVGCPSSYSITIDSSDTANVTISSNGQGVITVVSEGVSSNRRRKLQMLVGVDSSTGLANIESIQEIAD